MMTLTGIYLPVFPSPRAALWNICLFIGVLAICVMIAALDAFISLAAPSAIASVLTTAITVAIYFGFQHVDDIPQRVCSGAYWALVAIFFALVAYALAIDVFSSAVS